MAKTLPIKAQRGEGRALVLLHGLGNNHKSWHYVLKALDYTRFSVYVPDLLGFGDAPKPDVDYSPAVHAKAVIATIDKLGLKDIILAGHSMGSNVAIEVARQRPELISQLVLLGAPLYKSLPRRKKWKQFFRVEKLYFTIFELLRANPTMTIKGSEYAQKMLPLLHGMEITDETWVPFRRSLNNTIMQVESYKAVQKLQTPTLVIYGMLDIFVSKSNLHRAVRGNKKYLRFKTVLGPHEITPLQGKKIAKTLRRLSFKSPHQS